MNARGPARLGEFDPHGLQEALPNDPAAVCDAAGTCEALAGLVQRGLDRLPLPGAGAGATLQRWRALAAVAQHDLSLVKLYEGHTDALAILQELTGFEPDRGSTWGVWAAEARDAKVTFEPAENGSVCLRGTKPWCSGAAHLSHALLTAWSPDGQGPQLVRVALRQHGVSHSGERWQAVGMARSASLDVSFDGVQAHTVGALGSYLSRPGFWHGGAGIAACWYGGAVGLAQALRRATFAASAKALSAASSTPAPHPFLLAALGRVEVLLAQMAALLREAAHGIDEHPTLDARTVALRVRLAAEDGAMRVLDEVSCSLGAAPFCRDAQFARLAADLPVFIRQSHAAHDAATLGALVSAPEAAWSL